MLKWKAIARMRLADLQDNVNPHILSMLEGTFSLDAVHLETYRSYPDY